MKARPMPPRRLLLACPLLLASCGGPPPAPPTVLNATLAATADANGAAPISIRVYQLVSPAGFEAAQFFPLFNTDAAVLKDDIVKRDDLLLAPGQSRTLALTPPDRAKSLGVFAAYKDYESATWHAVVPIPAHATSTVAIAITAAGVTIKVEPAKP